MSKEMKPFESDRLIRTLSDKTFDLSRAVHDYYHTGNAAQSAEQIYMATGAIREVLNEYEEFAEFLGGTKPAEHLPDSTILKEINVLVRSAAADLSNLDMVACAVYRVTGRGTDFKTTIQLHSSVHSKLNEIHKICCANGGKINAEEQSD